MGHRRSGAAAQAWDQLDLLDPGQGVGGRQSQEPATEGGGGYLNECTPPEVRQRRTKKNFAKFPANSQLDPREAALLSELDAMGLSRVMLQIAQTIGFDNFMAMWQILDGSPELWIESESGISVRLQRLSTYKRFQRNRFIEAMAAMGKTQLEISRSVTRDLGEKVSDRHIWRLMAGGRIKP